ncbi:glucose-6-phosphate isomerase [Corynebacterium urealyticum]|uniref:glucose-6-phosphate isomerase n=1 Tax=Corynebacterium urealyticum TaxID=43771 RepID=UPI0002B3FBFE|nr:glucose-6-phosphate isomerase [Corynebacterium urealyticum]AGE37046.1 glucose-6-phosphate isomerase [Corynebacterium urealyticum DSM 7111]QQB06927.1 glucose-6-phosphate isomerase [Corynebacterium urealyticum]
MSIPPNPQRVTSTAPWQELQDYKEGFVGTTLREIFNQEATRVEDMTIQAGPLHIDLSKNLADARIMELLVQLGEAMGLPEYRDAMMSGATVNTTENRAALHTALRIPVDQNFEVDGVDVAADVHEVLGRMRDFCRDLRSGRWLGITGRTIKQVVNIGIGGSDLGPSMAATALRPYRTAGIEPYFVSNLDPADLSAALDALDPESCLFVISSKTFSTQETLVNARAAKQWLLTELERRGVPADTSAQRQAIIEKHFVAVSTNREAVTEFGIDPANMFGFWDWVGGRYSVDSAIGLTLMAAIGPQDFDQFLAGLHDVDEHFRTAPLHANAPALMGLLSVWYRDFLDSQSHAVMPYSEDLREFPDYLQQLTMESLGKSVRLDGTKAGVPTGPVYWGAPGTNGQHAFFQLLHQGTQLIPSDFIGFCNPHGEVTTQPEGTKMHDMLMANFFAQTRVLAFGRTADELRAAGTPEELIPHKEMPGNQPSTTILADMLTPRSLGGLIALYEHITFVQSVIWGINAFDQWGVEFGKLQASDLLPAVRSTADVAAGDGSTDALISFYRQHRNEG